MPLRQKPSRIIRHWDSEEQYLKDQDDDSSWSHATAWGAAASNKFVQFGAWLDDRLCHDDAVADFGGNDGFASFNFYLAHKIKPLVIDCDPKRLQYAEVVFKLSILRAFIDDLPLEDKSIDWAFCSHTLEHMRDLPKALREMSRVIKRGCYFVMPLEDLAHARKNHAHAVCIKKIKDWAGVLTTNNWKVLISKKVTKYEGHIYAEPKCE